jgi:hypothetical protein
MSGQIEFTRREDPIENVDICICIKGQNFEKTLLDLGFGGSCVNLFIMDGNEDSAVEDFLHSRSWSFNTISLWKQNKEFEEEVNLTVLYDWLIKKGQNKYVGYISGDCRLSKYLCSNVISALCSYETCGAVSIWTDIPEEDEKYPYTCLGFGVLQYAILEREIYKSVGGFDLDFDFKNARQDLTLKICTGVEKEVLYVSDHVGKIDKPADESFYSDDLEQKNILINKWQHIFPENKFPPIKKIVGYDFDLQKDYLDKVATGYETMRKSSAVICGLARDVFKRLNFCGLSRLEYLSGLFKETAFVIYENDSEDGTDNLLEKWGEAGDNRHVFSEKLDEKRIGGRSKERVTAMAIYRNKCVDFLKNNYSNFDYYIPVDLDLVGGISYDGIAHTIGNVNVEWDFMGSNGKNSMRGNVRYWDTFPHREIDCDDFSIGRNKMFALGRHFSSLKRGEGLVPVNSCFGGMAIYKISSIQNAIYTGQSSEHVAFNRSIIDNGGKGFVNPSQIVLYNYINWCKDQNGRSFNDTKFYEQIS